MNIIAIYCENSSLNRYLNKILSAFNMDLNNVRHDNVFMNFFVQTFYIYMLVNTSIVLYIIITC